MEENKDGVEFFNLVRFMFSLVDTDKGRNALLNLLKALKDKDYEGLSEVMGATIDTSRKAVDAINEVLAKQAEEHGITVKEMIDGLFIGNKTATT